MGEPGSDGQYSLKKEHNIDNKGKTGIIKEEGRIFLTPFFFQRKMGQHLTNEEGEQVDIDAAELQEWYKKFVVECPSGTLFMHEFKQFFGVQNNQEAGDYVENMFKAFDKNGVSNVLFFSKIILKLHLK